MNPLPEPKKSPKIVSVTSLSGSSWIIGATINEDCWVESIHHMKSLGVVRVDYSDGQFIEIPWHAVAFLRWSAK